MIIKYSNPYKLALYVFFALLKSLQVVFVAFIFQKFIDFAQKPQGSLIKLTTFAVLRSIGIWNSRHHISVFLL